MRGTLALCAAALVAPRASFASADVFHEADQDHKCITWAESGECAANPGYMSRMCAASCKAVEGRVAPRTDEVEQCAGWAEGGECTRNAGYMLAACRTSCERQRASAHEALLDTDLDCASWADEGGCGRAAIDVAAAAAAASHARADGDGGASEDARKLQRCAGSCAGLDLCAAAGLRNGTAADAAHAAGNGADGGGAAAAEWRVCVDALRCQELLDREPSCAQRAARGECASEPGLLLSRCFLSCARFALPTILALYADASTVHTRQSLIDASRPAAALAPSARVERAPCWDETPFAPVVSGSTPARRTIARALGAAALVAICRPRGGHGGWHGGWANALVPSDAGLGGARVPPLPGTVAGVRAHFAALTPRVPHDGGRLPHDAWAVHAAASVAHSAAAVAARAATPRDLSAERVVAVLPSGALRDADGGDEAARAERAASEGGRVYRVVHLSHSPRVRLLHDFVSADEAAAMLKLAQPLFQRSRAGGRVETIRSSSTAYLANNAMGPLVRAISARAAAATGYAISNIEPLQVVRYYGGELYRPHFDFGKACDFLENLQMGRRHVTMLIYLNDVRAPDNGTDAPADPADGPAAPSGLGETIFPQLRMHVTPRAGTALVFNDCLDDGGADERTLHGGEPPAPGAIKYAINVWIRAHAFQQRAGAAAESDADDEETAEEARGGRRGGGGASDDGVRQEQPAAAAGARATRALPTSGGGGAAAVKSRWWLGGGGGA